MSNQPSSSPSNEVVVLDNTPPRPHAPSALATANEVIVLDNSPPQNPDPGPPMHAEPIVVEENPPKRRRRDNPTSLPPHPRASSRSRNTAPVIVVEDDHETSDPEQIHSPTNSVPFTPVASIPVSQTHVRISPSPATPTVDDIIEMAARGPSLTANPTIPHSQTPTVSPPLSSLAMPPTTRHTSMPPLFAFAQRSVLGPEVAAPVSRSHSHNYTVFPQPPISAPSRTQNRVPPVNSVPSNAFPQPLPEQALPSNGRRSMRMTNTHMSFVESLARESFSPSARASLQIIRGLEQNGILRPAPPSAMSESAGEPFIQILSGTSAYLDTPQNSLRSAVPHSIPGDRLGSQGTTQRANLFTRNQSSSINRRRHAPSELRNQPPIAGNVTATNLRSRRGAGLTGVSVARAHMQRQINAMQATSNSAALEGDAFASLARRRAALERDASAFLARRTIGTPNAVIPIHRRHMVFTSNPVNNSTAPGHDSASSETRAPGSRATHTVATGSPSNAAFRTGRGPTRVTATHSPALAMASSMASSMGARQRNRNRRPGGNNARRIQNMQQIHDLLRFGTAVTTGIEIQYRHGLPGFHGDRALDYEQLIRLDEELIREKNRADKTQIESLPMQTATALDKEVRCCICMCDVEEGEELRVLPCSHKYHKKCIDEWLTYNGCCPVDKKRITLKRSRGSSTSS